MTVSNRPWVAAYGAEIAPDLPVSEHASLAHLISRTCETHAKRRAFTCVVPNGMNGSLTYQQVGQMSDDFASFLRHHCKLAPGTRVAVQLPNGLAYPVVAFGVFKAGCVLVNTNPLYTPNEMVHQFRDSEAEVLIISDLFADKLEEVVAHTAIKQVVLAGVAEFFPRVPEAIVRGVQKFWSRVLPPVPSLAVPVLRLREALKIGRDHDRVQDWDSLRRDDLALLQYTGGTTGVAKGAMLTHGNILANLEQVKIMGGRHMSGEDCVLTALPLYHIFAFTANLMTFFDLGARNILVPSPRPVANIQRALENYPVSWITGVNTLFNGLMNEEWFAAYPPKTLKAAIAGGTALHQAVAERWQTVTGTRVAEGYGLTETSPLVSFNPLDQPVRPGSIGVPVPGTDIALVDHNAEPVEQGKPGELLVKGPQVMRGYWNRPDDTAQTLQNGWVFTGDVAVMDEDGFLTIVDRKKDLVLVSGFNVYPNEVEDCLSKLDAVLEAAVIGVPDRASGEAVRAYVVQNPDVPDKLSKESVIAHCRKYLAAYKVPKSIILREELPKSPIGKILRKDLKAEARAEFAGKA
ncbi:AMP-binding protein [Roseinatronobacter bogoriensis]|uniref:Long-chain-fatty-acid--CoA ligase n=1 Tax=Roseinatronobacter bogoriensis subsp. barguzinensis TaxID=441209 RepID=A0A2K8KE45_9RHOB|nr:MULTISPECIES: AMP-binding protein [Rhodobaca]ATX67691.1 long-chain fatty acid--CoA ligase [Rhodobaca barguzinensis]MBB4209393.1 long-chain acyl-CoA synthetase [Rhodobaca bogoriensis DSM 18756]TDW34546.1 long-chain acyl-CoA synthetase [Rhodobaca barguzinensis]TDY67135.1 long-chain acyl-CoA synthetase [Rhodobaca bogoriensis DSM 18756]